MWQLILCCWLTACSSNMQQLVIQPLISTKQFDIALLKARTTFAQSIGAPSIPTVLWDDVGGLGQVKEEILDTVQLPLDHPELFQAGLKKRSGYSYKFTCNNISIDHEFSYRCFTLWSSRNWKNSTCKSSGNLLFFELPFSQRTRVTQYVHW